MKKFGFFLLLFLFWIFLVSAVIQVTPFGDAYNAANNYIANPNFEKAVAYTGNSNLVTAFLFNFRAYDTFVVLVLIFTSLNAILAVLKREKKTDITRLEYFPVMAGLVVTSIVKFFIPVIMLYSFYIIFQGVFSSGGGFPGGAIIAAGVLIFTLIFGLKSYVDKLPVAFRQYVESSAILAVIIAGILSLLLGGNFLEFPLSDFSPKDQVLFRCGINIFLELVLGVSFGVIFSSMFACIEKIE